MLVFFLLIDRNIVLFAYLDLTLIFFILLAVAQVDVSDSMIIRRLEEKDLKIRRAGVWVFLSPQHARLAFAGDYRNQNEEKFWGRSIYSDEKTFR